MNNPAFSNEGPNDAASDYNATLFVINSVLATMQTATLAEVVAVDTDAGTVDIKVLVNLLTANGVAVPHGVIYGLPYFRLQGGNNGIIIDPVVGDKGPAVFCSRDISGVVAAKGQASPGSLRKFDWSDGLYFGGLLNTSPAQFIQFITAGILIKSPTKITLQSPNNLVDGPLEVTGDATFDLDVAATGAVHAATLHAADGFTGTFETGDSRTATVVDGIITGVV